MDHMQRFVETQPVVATSCLQLADAAASRRQDVQSVVARPEELPQETSKSDGSDR